MIEFDKGWDFNLLDSNLLLKVPVISYGRGGGITSFSGGIISRHQQNINRELYKFDCQSTTNEGGGSHKRKQDKFSRDTSKFIQPPPPPTPLRR